LVDRVSAIENGINQHQQQSLQVLTGIQAGVQQIATAVGASASASAEAVSAFRRSQDVDRLNRVAASIRAIIVTGFDIRGGGGGGAVLNGAAVVSFCQKLRDVAEIRALSCDDRKSLFDEVYGALGAGTSTMLRDLPASDFAFDEFDVLPALPKLLVHLGFVRGVWTARGNVPTPQVPSSNGPKSVAQYVRELSVFARFANPADETASIPLICQQLSQHLHAPGPDTNAGVRLLEITSREDLDKWMREQRVAKLRTKGAKSGGGKSAQKGVKMRKLTTFCRFAILLHLIVCGSNQLQCTTYAAVDTQASINAITRRRDEFDVIAHNACHVVSAAGVWR